MVVTNKMNVTNFLARDTDCEFMFTSGELRLAYGELVGNLAIDIIKQVKFDLAVI